MNLKKIVGIVGIITCIALLIAAGTRLITLRLFWILLIFMAVLAYFIVPKVPE